MNAYAYLIGWRIVRWLPQSLAYRIFYFVGNYVYRKNGKGIKRLRNNMAKISGLQSEKLELLTKDAMRSYMRYWCDTFRLPDWSTEKIHSTVELVNGHLMTDPLDNGRGVVISLPHSGNWDHAAAYFLNRGYKLVTVAERLKPERVFQAFLKYRENLGMEILPTDMRTIPTLISKAKDGYIVPLVADRDLSSNGVEVNFFNSIAKMPAGPVIVAEKAEVDLVGAFIIYTKTGIKIYFEKLEKSVQSEADFFEKYLKLHPTDWHMLQRIWVND